MSRANIRRHYSDKKSASKSANIAKVLIVLLSMILSGLLLLTASAYFALNSASPLSLSVPLALASLYFCSFIGGGICAFMLNNPDSYICAAISSSAFLLITLFLKTVIPCSNFISKATVSVALHALIPIVCLTGVMLTEKILSGNNKRHKIRR